MGSWVDSCQRIQQLLLSAHQSVNQPKEKTKMSMTHTIMAVDTKAGTASVQNWECSENIPLGKFFNEITRGGKRFFSSDEGMWIVVERLHGNTFTLEFGEPAG